MYVYHGKENVRKCKKYLERNISFLKGPERFEVTKVHQSVILVYKACN